MLSTYVESPSGNQTSASVIAGLTILPRQRTITTHSTSSGLAVDGTLFDLPAGPARVAVGGEALLYDLNEKSRRPKAPAPPALAAPRYMYTSSAGRCMQHMGNWIFPSSERRTRCHSCRASMSMFRAGTTPIPMLVQRPIRKSRSTGPSLKDLNSVETGPHPLWHRQWMSMVINLVITAAQDIQIRSHAIRRSKFCLSERVLNTGR